MTDTPTNRTQRMDVLLLMAALLFLALYAILRYGGLWSENDTGAFLGFTKNIIENEQLTPDKGLYANGYGYQSLLVFLYHLTDVDLTILQTFGASLFSIWIVLPAWLLYRELTDSFRGATLATVILLIQPEFLFPLLLRGSHEKFTRGLMLFGLYILLRSLRSKQRTARFASFVLVFYLVIYGITTFNNLFATSYISALAIALIFIVASLTKSRWTFIRNQPPALNHVVRRLLSTIMISLCVAFLFTFYAYSPAQQQIRLLHSVWDKLAALFLEVTKTGSALANPYGVITGGWIAQPVYLLVSLASWLLLMISIPLWLWQSWQLIKGERQFDKPNDLLLWAFYGTFSFFVFLSIIVDLSGAIAGNLQLRMFPSFAMFAAPLIAKWLIESPRLFGNRLVRNGVVLGIGVLAILSVFKATNEPLLSNKWLFYASSEIKALDWAEKTLPDRAIWAGYDERLFSAAKMYDRLHDIKIDKEGIASDTQNILISDIIRARRTRLNAPWMVEPDSYMTYDNGHTQIYHLRPQTPYQK